jgi:hypothetical protein
LFARRIARVITGAGTLEKPDGSPRLGMLMSDPLRVQMFGPLSVVAAGFSRIFSSAGIGPGPLPSSCS